MVRTRSAAKADENGVKGSRKMNGVEKVQPQAAKEGFLSRLFNKTLFPLLLMAIMPQLVILLWFTERFCDGSFLVLVDYFKNNGIGGLLSIWSGIYIASPFSLAVVGGFCLFSLILMVLVPGPRSEGPVTPKGNIPVYKDNGFSCFVITMFVFAGLQYGLKQYGLSVSVVYDRFDEILATLNIFSLVFCIVLYLKGRFAPTTNDSGHSGNLIFDYYWGTELYPRFFGIDVKVFTNCRFGLTVWPLLICIYAVKSYELYGFVDSMFVSVFLQMLYLAKFFWWEAGYMRTIDIMLDRAGFYICWGCLVYVPSLYTYASLYLVKHPNKLGPFVSAFFLIFGVAAIVINYWADQQKLEVRATNGNCIIWGKKPEIIRATYRLESGQNRHSILLVSGFWGLARHFHYLPEITLAVFWSLPALFENVAPHSYWIFLVILLTHRSFRDDDKCGAKYGKYWVEYRKRVPSRIIPGIF